MASAKEKYLEICCNFLSLSVTAVSLLTRIPQIYQVYVTNSSRCLNLISVILEEIGYACIIAYNVAKRYPLESYLEYVILNIEVLILILLILQSRDMLTFNVVYYGLFFVVAFVGVATQKLPDSVLTVLLSVNVPASALSKFMQIYTVFTMPDTGDLCKWSWLLALYVTAVHSFTTYLKSGDQNIILINACFAVLNAMIVFILTCM